MIAADIMTKDPRTISVNASVAEAVDLLQSMNVRHLPVVDERSILVGIVSDRDLGPLMKMLIENADVDRMVEPPERQSLADLMSTDPIALHEDADIGEIVDAIVDERIGAVPIVDDADRVVGIISYVDLLRALRPESGAAVAPGRTTRPAMPPT